MIFFFFLGNLEIFSGSNSLFRGWTFHFFLNSFFFVKRKVKLHYRTVKCKAHEKRDWLQVSKVEFNFQISQRNKKTYLLIQFSRIGLIFIENAPVANYFRNSESFKGIYFFL